MSRSLVDGIRKPSVSACEGLCGPRAKDVASEDTREAVGKVQPVWAEIGGVNFAGISPEEKGTVGGSGGSFWGQIWRFRPAEKSTR